MSSSRFEALKDDLNVLVVAPHRSRTTAVAAMIAHDLGYELVLEEGNWLPNWSTERLDRKIAEPHEGRVFQVPWLLWKISFYPHCFVVYCDRPLDEILASQERMYDKDGHKILFSRIEIIERQKYNVVGDNRPIAEIKRENWMSWQKDRLPRHMTLDVNSLSDHPLWRDNREGFNVRQIERGEEIPERLPPLLPDNWGVIRGSG